MSLFEEDVVDIKIEDSIKRSYLDYSMSVIIGRALPNVKDGLKPVHRRILYGMDNLNITSKTPYKKSARIVGDVIGKYHPHGDTAVYDAIVRMAQPFSMKETIIDGQGNFGSIDGDNAAAMRYTEARLTPYAEELLKDLDKNTVNFLPNYDESLNEPEVLPTRVPNLLVNGTSGIAVGMATNIPPHNLNEVVDATIQTISNPNITIEEISKIIVAPDFPTKGVIYGKQGIKNAYETGKGKIKIRATTHVEEVKNREIIVIDELPYQVNKSKLVESIADLAKEKVIEGISNIRDESDREGIRVVIELKRDAMSEIVLNNLFKSTNMEITFGIIFLAIVDQEPKILNIKEILEQFIKHRKTVVIRRTIFELEKAKARAHILEGLKKALDHIEEIIKVIRASESGEVARENLITKFDFSKIQAQAILDMRLQKLTGLEREKIENELAELLVVIADLEETLKNEDKLKNIIKDELEEIKRKFNTPRATEIVEDYDDINIEDLIVNEPMVVTISHKGYIKRVPVTTYNKQKRGGKGKTAATIYEDDFLKNFFISDTLDTLMFITDFGQLYWIKVYKIPEASRTAKGKAIVNLINLQPNEKIRSIIPTKDFDGEKSLAFFTKKGLIKKTNLENYSNIRANGIRAIILNDDDELITARIIEKDAKWIFMATSEGICIRFSISDVREVGRTAKGVTGIKLKENDRVIGADIIKNDEHEILTVSSNGIAKRTEAKEYREQKRAGKGIIAMKLTQKTGKLIGLVMVNEEKDLMTLTKSGKMIRVDMQSIRKAGRNTSGVKLIDLSEAKDTVLDISSCPKQKEEEDEINQN